MTTNFTLTDTYIIDKPKNFDITQIFDCGQCFRFNRSENEANTYEGVAFGKFLKISQDKDKLYFHGVSKQDFENTWHTFLDFDTNYGDIIETFFDDDVLYTAANFSAGIRILRQDKWEALCSFIISQNNNIPRIKGIIENMSKKYGKPFVCYDGVTRYSFPTAQSLYNAGVDEIFALKTGFRAKYIYDAAKKICEGQLDLEKVTSMPLDEASKTLEQIKGVGPKVAACTLLFGFRKFDAFPIDVWVKKILSKYYSKGQSKHFSDINAGIAQQYLFYYERCQSNVFI